MKLKAKVGPKPRFQLRIVDIKHCSNKVFLYSCGRYTIPPNFMSVSGAVESQMHFLCNYIITLLQHWKSSINYSFEDFSSALPNQQKHAPPVPPTHHHCWLFFSRPLVVTCSFNHVAHNPLCLVYTGLEKPLISPVCQLKVNHSALCSFYPQSSFSPLTVVCLAFCISWPLNSTKLLNSVFASPCATLLKM